MKSDFDTALPSIVQVQTLIKEAIIVELKLLSGDLLTGKISWQDQNCLCIIDQSNNSITVWQHAIAYVKPKN